METMKKSYHSACKEEKLAASRENNSKLESNNNPEAQKKLQEKVEKCQQEVQKVRCEMFPFLPRCGVVPLILHFIQTKERYEKSLEELDKLTPQYMENMEQVFEQWQQFEDKRIRFFRELLLEVKQHLDLSTNHRSAVVQISLAVSPGQCGDVRQKVISFCPVSTDSRLFTTRWKTRCPLPMRKRI